MAAGSRSHDVFLIESFINERAVAKQDAVALDTAARKPPM
jgi:hypothetical protein